jgi:hypothetical protein
VLDLFSCTSGMYSIEQARQAQGSPQHCHPSTPQCPFRQACIPQRPTFNPFVIQVCFSPPSPAFRRHRVDGLMHRGTHRMSLYVATPANAFPAPVCPLLQPWMRSLPRSRHTNGTDGGGALVKNNARFTRFSRQRHGFRS